MSNDPLKQVWVEKLLEMIHKAAQKTCQVDIRIFLNRKDRQTGRVKPPSIEYVERHESS